MANKNLVPDANASVLGEGGRFTDIWYAFMRRVGRALAELETDGADLKASAAGKSQVWSETILIPGFVTNGTYFFAGWPYNGTIDKVVTKSISGSCTLEVAVGGQPLGGGSNAVSAARDETVHAADNILADDLNDVTLTVTSNAACFGMAVTIRGTHRLD